MTENLHKTYTAMSKFYINIKKLSFRDHIRPAHDSKPSSCHRLSRDVTFTGPATAMAALYWTNSILLLKKPLSGLSCIITA